MRIEEIKIIMTYRSNLEKSYKIKRTKKNDLPFTMGKEKNQNTIKEYILKILKMVHLKTQ